MISRFDIATLQRFISRLILFTGTFIQCEPERDRINVFSAGRHGYHSWPAVSNPTGQEHRYHELKKLTREGTQEAIAMMRFGSITIDEMK